MHITYLTFEITAISIFRRP